MNMQTTCRRLVLAFLFVLSAANASAQARGDTASPEDLLQDIAALERVREHRGSAEDQVRASFLLGYIQGMLHVHAENAELWRTMADPPAGAEPLVSDETARIGVLFAPLEAVSHRLDVEQSIGALKLYLERHPQQGKAPWHLLVQNALFDIPAHGKR